MDTPDHLIESIADEDSMLRRRLKECPDSLIAARGHGGALSFKETLGHLAFWDSFAVQFFLQKLESNHAGPPVNFEERNREELQRIRGLPFAEVLALYQQATQGLVKFLRSHWSRLSAKERKDFLVPLKHRRHHRLLLFRALDAAQKELAPDQKESQA